MMCAGCWVLFFARQNRHIAAPLCSHHGCHVVWAGVTEGSRGQQREPEGTGGNQREPEGARGNRREAEGTGGESIFLRYGGMRVVHV